jgi:hypothetical protein
MAELPCIRHAHSDFHREVPSGIFYSLLLELDLCSLLPWLGHLNWAKDDLWGFGAFTLSPRKRDASTAFYSCRWSVLPSTVRKSQGTTRHPARLYRLHRQIVLQAAKRRPQGHCMARLITADGRNRYDMDWGIGEQKPLFAQRAPDGSAISFVCFDDGYAVYRDGTMIPECRWPTILLDSALESYRLLVRQDRRSVLPASSAF